MVGPNQMGWKTLQKRGRIEFYFNCDLFVDFLPLKFEFYPLVNETMNYKTKVRFIQYFKFYFEVKYNLCFREAKIEHLYNSNHDVIDF